MEKDNRRLPAGASSMRLRLYAFLFTLVMFLVLGVFLVFYILGRFPASTGDLERFVNREYEHLYGQMSEQFGDITVQLVSLSQSLSRSIEFQLSEKQIPVGQFREYPELLEELIGNEVGRLQYALERTSASGVFMVLDATVNPTLEYANNSRAGMYIRVSEPYVAGAATATYNYFRGFSRIAYQNNMNIMVKWDMEFDIENRDFYHLPIESSINSNLPLSKLYYWSMEGVIADLDDVSISCSIPLIDSDGNAFGVCGFDISQWNFNTRYLPDTSVFRDVVSVFGAVKDNGLYTDTIFITGRNTLINVIRENRWFPLPAGTGLLQFLLNDGTAFYGTHNEARLYPHDSPFSDYRHVLALLVSKSEVDAGLNRENLQLVAVCAVLLTVGFAISLFIGRRYLNPIESALIAIRAGKLDGVKTNIRELDQLVEQVKAQRANNRPFPDDFIAEYYRRIKTLSPVEKRLLDCYINGADDKEIMTALFITKDALRKHNQRIFEKLGVSGKDVLIMYIELIKMSGQADKFLQ